MGSDKPKPIIRTQFSDYFKVNKALLEKENILDISLIADLPLFIDPFLLFNSEKPEYQKLHKEIVEYIAFLKSKSITHNGNVPKGLLEHLYRFPEVKQNWLGFTFMGNAGHGLGPTFAKTLNSSFESSLSNFGTEGITVTSHLEKLSLVSDGVGRDNISDFATNLLKEYLLEFTQAFARKHIDKSLLKVVPISRAHFNYQTETWADKNYELPWYKDDFILLTPRDLLTKDSTWVNKLEFYKDFDKIPYAVGNEELRAKMNNFLIKTLHDNTKEKKIVDGEMVYKTSLPEKIKSYKEVLVHFPELADYFLKTKEDNKQQATPVSAENVKFVESVLIENLKDILQKFILAQFFETKIPTSYEEALERVKYFKECIENHDVWKNLYYKGKPLGEEYVQRLFKLVWYGTIKDLNREVENGRGIVDFTVSAGAMDKAVIEFKLAKTSSLEKNLKSQLEIYKKVNNTEFGIWLIVYFDDEEKRKVERILKKLEIQDAENIVLVDAREKLPASKV